VLLEGLKQAPGSFAVSIEIDQDMNLARVHGICRCLISHAVDRNELVRAPLRSRETAAEAKVECFVTQRLQAAATARRGEGSRTAHLHLNVPLCPVSFHHLGERGVGGEGEIVW
jgi:hypothetical protein